MLRLQKQNPRAAIFSAGEEEEEKEWEEEEFLRI